jgi:hypothetical protein
MQETINFINEMRFQQECPDVLPHPGAGSQPEDSMFHRAYQ